MSIIRVVHNRENPFVQLSRKALWDERLSLKAVGLWSRCMSRPDNWRFNIKELVSKCKEGRKAIDGVIHELIETGYALRVDLWDKDTNGRFTNKVTEYVFFEFPATQEDKDKIFKEFSLTHRFCRLGNLRDRDIQNDHLQIDKEEEIEIPKEYISSCPSSRRDESSPPPRERDPEPKKIAEHLWKRVLAIHPKAKPPKLEFWAEEIERAHRIDKRSYEDLIRVIDYAFDQDSFWVKVLQSAEGLRRNFDKIWVKMTPLSNAGINAQKNTALVREAQAQLKASGSEKYKQFFITDGVLIKLDTGDRISLSLEPSSFEQDMIRIFALRKYE